MITNITKDIVKIVNMSTIDGEFLSSQLLFHNILSFLLKKLKENRRIQCFYIEKSKILTVFKEILKISKIFPFFIIVSDEIPCKSEEFTCILQKFKEKYRYNTRKFYKFLDKQGLTYLKDIYIKEDLRFTMAINNFNI